MQASAARYAALAYHPASERVSATAARYNALAAY